MLESIIAEWPRFATILECHSDHEVVVEIPAGLAPGSYRLIVTTTGADKQSSEPFSAGLFAAR